MVTGPEVTWLESGAARSKEAGLPVSGGGCKCERLLETGGYAVVRGFCGEECSTVMHGAAKSRNGYPDIIS